MIPILVGIIVLGMFAYSCHPRVASDQHGPTPPKCWSEQGWELC